ncbi:hypothetical protein BLNAU_18792 [Blattamonas nauphoetae]|uniref:Uncharacterized protein n=1 Tax=Blattamonas nauphoetae TaxID=2049346 RepID=A0ABQ9X6M7_9EUKA|nr:hypothetical protein BLNAU_18792 [Blattamonas nauphoetae]
MNTSFFLQSRPRTTVQSHPPASIPIFLPEREPFLNFERNSKLSFEDKSTVYCSLVALVNAKFPFDNALQDKAVQFLNHLEPEDFGMEQADKLVTDLALSSDGSPSGFVESILTLLSSPHSIVVTATLSLLRETAVSTSVAVLLQIAEADLIANILAIVQPQTLPVSGNEKTIDHLVNILIYCVSLAFPSPLRILGITAAFDKYNHREMIFQKVVIPSSQFMTFLITNQQILIGDLAHSFFVLLCAAIRIGPLHHPTLDYVLASPIVMTFSSRLSTVEHSVKLWFSLNDISQMLKEWKEEGVEVVQSGKRIVQALFSEGFEDILEQQLKHSMAAYIGTDVVDNCHSISQLLGLNVKKL